MNTAPPTPAVWFPAIRAGSGADVFTERLVAGLQERGIRAEITWLPHRAEYAPWSVAAPQPPRWATVVHVNSWLPPRFVPRQLPLIMNMLHCVHDPALAPYKSMPQKLYHHWWIKPTERALIRRARHIVAISRYTADRTREAFRTGDISVIPIGIQPDGPFQPPHAQTSAHHPFRLLFVGNWSARKGCDLLAPIMRTLGKDFELWALTGLRGHRPDNLPANVRLLARRENENALAELYHECDALLFPSRLEGFGMVALEAQSCGLPVVATNGSALPEVVEDGVSGLLCSPESPEEFAQAARRLAEDKGVFDSLRIGARRRVIEYFDMGRMIDCYIALYESTLSR
ncbi:hypothetical protein BJI67_13240 [Acidihalobacter aeolianus]|uniref:Glycosyltransferase subfamily 4-like N-terminal domain-containing protein n=1 Tax=Acidihalobacter aeolianus TaxID=2792603 RepID=A0A1D8KA96_9GAMM|nr:glycosyltransferase family 4 protein [Acidihalobacter aeolianus]AOV17893.1 hypothetical protein BJI67_13240 [Acidihalobacter aeolianus]